jgi:nitroreductase
MELSEAIKGRRSIRKFKPANVPQTLLKEIFDAARWSPSWGNTQPWEFYVLSGKALDKFRQMNLQKTIEGAAASSDVPMPENWSDVQKARYMDLGKVVLTSLGIKREDKESRNKYYMDMVTAFGAPCLIFACIDRDNLLEYPMLDIGLITQTICLIAHDKGLGTCLMAATARYAAEIRKIAAIPENKKIVVGIALGYPDWDFPLNNIKRERAGVDEIVHWVE